MTDDETPLFKHHYTKADKIDVDDDRLIELVKLHPEIYDTRHKQYLNSSRKRGIWTQIGKELDRDPDDCKHRWVNIRDTLRKTIVKRERRRRRGITKVYRYKFEPQLGFLIDYFNGLPLVYSEPIVEHEEVLVTQPPAKSYKQSRACQEHTVPKKRVSEKSIDEFDEPMISFCDFPAASNYNSPLHSETDNQTSDFRRSARDPLETYPSSGLYQTDGRNVNRQKPTSTSTHPVDTFLAGIASTMKGLSPYFQNIAKSRIFQVVQSIELDQIKRMRNVQSVDECDDIMVDAECMEDQLPVQLMITKVNSLSE